MSASQFNLPKKVTFGKISAIRLSFPHYSPSKKNREFQTHLTSFHDFAIPGRNYAIPVHSASRKCRWSFTENVLGTQDAFLWPVSDRKISMGVSCKRAVTLCQRLAQTSCITRGFLLTLLKRQRWRVPR